MCFSSLPTQPLLSPPIFEISVRLFNKIFLSILKESKKIVLFFFFSVLTKWNSERLRTQEFVAFYVKSSYFLFLIFPP